MKLDIENVLLMIGVEQYCPLANFETTYFHIMVEKSKELLNSLYTKVLQYELPTENNIHHNESIKTLSQNGKKSLDLTLPLEEKRIRGCRPNYFAYELNQPISKSIRKIHISPKEIERKKIGNLFIKIINLHWFLEKRMSELMYNIEKIINSFEEPDYIQLKFLAQYENDPLVFHRKIIKIVIKLYRL